METKIQCDICNKMYKTDKTLATHKKKYHKDIDESSKENIITDEKDILNQHDLSSIEDIIENIKSVDSRIVDVRFMVTGDDIKWFCGLEKIKEDYEFDTIEERFRYYRELQKRNKLIIL
jgi:hypothetical protein